MSMDDYIDRNQDVIDRQIEKSGHNRQADREVRTQQTGRLRSQDRIG